MGEKIVIITIVDGTDEDILDFKRSFLRYDTRSRLRDKFFLVIQKA